MEYVNLKFNQEFRRCNMRLFFSLGQWKFVSAFRALGHSALYKRWTTRTSKCSAIRYVKSETALRTRHCVFRLRTHFLSLSPNQSSSKILKTFLETFNKFDAEILATLKTIILWLIPYEKASTKNELAWEKNAENGKNATIRTLQGPQYASPFK
jgi:hypothetical protein